MKESPQDEQELIDRERDEVLTQVEEILELPVVILGFAWLFLLFIELVWGLSPVLETAVYIIWGIFIIDFVLRFSLASSKLVFLRKNWLTLLSLMVPALRVFRLARAFRLLRLVRTARGLNLLRVIGSLNRGMRALRNTMSRRGFGYVVLLTVIVIFIGAAGMYTFEAGLPGFESYGEALWWTSMILTTMGSQAWPHTLEGRILGFLLSLYSFAVFGYVTATLASFFVGREAESAESEIAGAKSIEALRQEINALRQELNQANQYRSMGKERGVEGDEG